jgi:hypothetical protein
MAPVTRDEYRRKVVSEHPKCFGFWTWAFFILASPALLVVFLGDILAAPFVARRHQSTGHWLLYMFARFLGPAIIIGLCSGYLIGRYA